MFVCVIELASLHKPWFFKKKLFQEHTHCQPRKSHFGPPKILFRTPRDPGTPCFIRWTAGLYGVQKSCRDYPERKNEPNQMFPDPVKARSCRCKTTVILKGHPNILWNQILIVINLEFIGVCKTIVTTIHMGIGKSFYKQNFETNCWPKESNAKAKLRFCVDQQSYEDT